MTPFPEAPDRVVALTIDEFASGLELNEDPTLEVICARFPDDANRAVVWILRYRALQTVFGHLVPDGVGQVEALAKELAAGFELNDEWEFDRAAFLTTIARIRRRCRRDMEALGATERITGDDDSAGPS